MCSERPVVVRKPTFWVRERSIRLHKVHIHTWRIHKHLFIEVDKQPTILFISSFHAQLTGMADIAGPNTSLVEARIQDGAAMKK